MAEQSGGLLQSEPSSSQCSEDTPNSLLVITQTETVNVGTERRQTHVTGRIILASILAALGGILFGYDIGIISGALLQLKDVFTLSCLQRELVVASMLFGALAASFCGGCLVDQFGRKFSIILNSFTFVIGAVVLAVSNSFPVLIFGRLLVGFAVSLSAIAECVYISEIAPATRRGMLVSLNELGITIGFLLAYLMNFLLIDINNGWRYMFGLSVIPAVVQGVGMLFLPESPRFLITKHRNSQAKQSLVSLRGHENCDRELNDINNAVIEDRKPSMLDLFSNHSNMRTRLLIGMGLVFLQQFTGQPNVLYYAPTIFQSLGFESNEGATLATVGLGVVKMISTVVSLLCVDRAGRRKFLIGGTVLMFVGIVTLGITSNYLPPHSKPPCDVHQGYVLPMPHNHSQLTAHNDLITALNTAHNESRVAQDEITTEFGVRIGGFKVRVAYKWLALSSLMVFVAGYALGFGPVSWLVLSEIFPTSVKGRAMSLATVFNWGTNLIVSFTFLNFISAVGVSGTFLFYGGICGISLIYIYAVIPETRGRTLEEISQSLQSGSTMQRCINRCSCCKRGGASVYEQVLLTEDNDETERL